MTAGQLSIFDVLDEQSDTTICPHCGWSWSGSTTMAIHTAGANGWPFGASEAGQCSNQQRHLYNIAARVHFLPDDPRNPDPHDILWAILEAKQRGCTNKQVQKVLTTARK